jgi:hypothetical protein
VRDVVCCTPKDKADNGGNDKDADQSAGRFLPGASIMT